MRKISRITLLVSLILLLSFSIATAETVKTSAELKDLDSYIEKTMKDWKIPGLAIAVVKDGKVVYAKGFGYRDVEKNLKVTPDTLFAIGSTSKAFTSMCAGLLVDEGKLKWDTPIIKYLSDFKLYDPMATKEATVKDLLLHRTGLPRHSLSWYGTDYSRKQIYDHLKYLEPSASFRNKWQYNNQMYMTAGYLVGKLSNGTWEEFVDERIFTPLGMKNCSFSVEEMKKSPDHALAYKIIDEKVKLIPYRSLDAIGPAGSINASVNEMAKWLKLHTGDGKVDGKQFISKSNLDLMHSPQIPIPGKKRFSELGDKFYGFAWLVQDYRNHNLVWHNGGIDGFYALICLMPEDKMGVVILTNLNYGQHMGSEAIAYRVFDNLLKLKPIDWNDRLSKMMEAAKKIVKEQGKKKEDPCKMKNTKPSHPLEDYVGEYENPGYGVVKVVKKGNKLGGKFHFIDLDLEHYHYDVFQNKGKGEIPIAIQFHTDIDGYICSLSTPLESGIDPISFKKKPSKELKTKGYLKKFIGNYELRGQPLKIWFKNDNLNVTFPGDLTMKVVPVRKYRFEIENLPDRTLFFEVDKSGNIKKALLVGPEGMFDVTRVEK
ncbi:MAG: serine hydrolase [Candidatus Eremiobacteraeota bacterium]|nr:serine hydrolase [Candidatus Eremiobacteraeota bacterium]